MKIVLFFIVMFMCGVSFAGDYNSTCIDKGKSVHMEQSSEVYLYLQGYSPEKVQSPDDGFVRTKRTVIYNTQDYYGKDTDVTTQLEVSYKYNGIEAIVITPIFGEEPGEPVVQIFKDGKLLNELECTYDE